MKTPSRAIPPIILSRDVEDSRVADAIATLRQARRILNPSKSDPDVDANAIGVEYDFRDNRIWSCMVKHDLGGRSYSISTGKVVQIDVSGDGFDELRVEARAVADRDDALMPYHAAAVVTRAIAVLERLARQKPATVEETRIVTDRRLAALAAGLHVSGVTEGGFVVETRRPNAKGRLAVQSRHNLAKERAEALETWALEAIPPQISLSFMETPKGRRVVLMHARVGATLADDPIAVLRNIVDLPDHLRS